MLDTPPPGTVLATRNHKSAFGRLVRLAQAVRDQPNIDNHIAVYSHTDHAGTPWGIEGRPGGVGWVDVRHYLADPYTVTNRAQKIGYASRENIVTAMQQIIGSPYDWVGIGEDAAQSLGLHGLRKLLDRLWRDNGWATGGVPGHVVCSSAAAWAYRQSQVAHPTFEGERDCSPADWVQFIIENRYDD